MKRIAFGLLLASIVTAPVAMAQSGMDHPHTQAAPEPDGEYEVVPLETEEIDEIEKMQRAAFEKHGSLGIVTMGMKQPEIIVVCQSIAQSFTAFAAEETDLDRRKAKFVEVWRFEERLAESFRKARKVLGEAGYERALRKSGQALNLLTMMPDPIMKHDPNARDELMFEWAKGLSLRCVQMLDEMGIAKVSGDPPAEYLETKALFRYRGGDYTQIFAETELGPYAKDMCRGGEAPDFAGAPLDQRGYEGMSLLDWAIECDDRASFDALVAAGFDLDAKGLWEDPPLVRSASEKRLWFLLRLLNESVNPNAMGHAKTALMEANTDLDAINHGGDTRAAFNLLRERGASLNFPNFQESMWNTWSLHETRWDLILTHWDEFESDPVELASLLEYYLSGDMNWAKTEFEDAAHQVKALLIEEHGVCFPVGKPFEMEKDERGFRIQPDCQK